MKILYSTLASLLIVYAPLYSMEGQDDFTMYDMVADAAESERPISPSKSQKKGPSALIMERTSIESSPHDSKTIEKDFFALPTTNGSDEYDQDDSLNLVSQVEEHEVDDNQPLKKRKTASQRFIELIKDEKTTKKQANRCFKKVTKEQENELLDHYSKKETSPEELKKLFFYLKDKLSKISITDKKELFDHALCVTAYNTLKAVHFKGNKTEAKAFLYMAGYESDEEKIVKTGLQGDGDSYYRMSKKLLTTDLPALAVAFSSKEKKISDNILKKERLEKELKEVSDTLIKDNTEKSYISSSIDIIKKSRKQQKADLLDLQKRLEEKIHTLIDDINGLEEEAILGNAHNISAQKNQIKIELTATKIDLTNVQKNLKNFDTPTGYLSSYINK